DFSVAQNFEKTSVFENDLVFLPYFWQNTVKINKHRHIKIPFSIYVRYPLYFFERSVGPHHRNFSSAVGSYPRADAVIPCWALCCVARRAEAY
ncbi:MAG: hypothetical protein LBQ54_03360, partial [Planctomycetaceae bacterium]|nr:hypothetical protein [Planctomycetaceae bacterium]